MELKMRTDLETALPEVIDFNFEELKEELEERLQHYNTLVITEDAIKEGKEDRARMNKLRQAIDGKRKEVKAQCMAPYNVFESRVKELIGLIDAPIAAIDEQLSEYERIRQEKKRETIAEMYEATVPEDYRAIIPMQMIFSQKWLNATTSEKKIQEDLDTIVKRVEADMLVLNTVEPEYTAAVRETYIRTLDISKALAQREALKAAAAAFKEPVREVQPVVEEKPAVAAYEPQTAPVEKEEKVYVLRLEMQLTMNQANALKRFLSDNNIAYEKI